jgi:dTDP-glucose 4,6-dehydratase
MAGQVFDLSYTVLRPVNTYGRRHETGFIVEYLMTSMARGGPVYIGTPDSVRDFLYVEDHVNAYVEALKNEKACNQVLNVGSGEGVSMKDLARAVAEKMGYKGQIVYSYPPGYPKRPAYADPSYLVLDNTKIRKLLGWSPKYSLDKGLDKTIQAWCG